MKSRATHTHRTERCMKHMPGRNDTLSSAVDASRPIGQGSCDNDDDEVWRPAQAFEWNRFLVSRVTAMAGCNAAAAR